MLAGLFVCQPGIEPRLEAVGGFKVQGVDVQVVKVVVLILTTYRPVVANPMVIAKTEYPICVAAIKSVKDVSGVVEAAIGHATTAVDHALTEFVANNQFQPCDFVKAGCAAGICVSNFQVGPVILEFQGRGTIRYPRSTGNRV